MTKSIDVSFNVEVAPEFTLSNHKELPLTKRVYKVRGEDVESTIERLRQGHAELVPVEDRPSQAGDIVTVNLTGHVEDAEIEAAESPVEDITQRDLDIELGAAGSEGVH